MDPWCIFCCSLKAIVKYKRHEAQHALPRLPPDIDETQRNAMFPYCAHYTKLILPVKNRNVKGICAILTIFRFLLRAA